MLDRLVVVVVEGQLAVLVGQEEPLAVVGQTKLHLPVR